MMRWFWQAMWAANLVLAFALWLDGDPAYGTACFGVCVGALSMAKHAEAEQ